MQRELMTEAMQKGADAILVKHAGMTETGFTTVENKTEEKKKFGESSSTEIYYQIERNRILHKAK